MGTPRVRVPVADQMAWSLPEFAGVLGHHEEWLRRRIEWATPRHQGGVAHLPGLVDVPVHTDGGSHAIVYRHQYERAVQDAPTVLHRWDPDTQTTIEEPSQPAAADHRTRRPAGPTVETAPAVRSAPPGPQNGTH